MQEGGGLFESPHIGFTRFALNHTVANEISARIEGIQLGCYNRGCSTRFLRFDCPRFPASSSRLGVAENSQPSGRWSGTNVAR
jgi:hypothetical protein